MFILVLHNIVIIQDKISLEKFTKIMAKNSQEMFFLLYDIKVESGFKLSQKKYSLQVTALLHWSFSQ